MVIAEPSVKSLHLTLLANGLPLGTATGFMVGFTRLVTNWHVLSGRNPETDQIISHTDATPDAIRIRFHGMALGQFNEVELPLRDDDGSPLWFEVPHLGRLIDVASIEFPVNVGQVERLTPEGQVEYSTPIHFYNYDLNNPNPSDIYLSVTERVSIIGYPTGEDVQGFPIWTQGFIASEPDLNFRGLPCLLIDSRTRQGQSGSPVVYYSSSGQYPTGPGVTTLGAVHATRFVGIYSGRLNAQSDIGRVWMPQAVTAAVESTTRATSL